MSVRFNGTGVGFLGICAQDASNECAATRWLTLLFLPLVPLARYQLRVLEPDAHGNEQVVIVGSTPMVAREVLRTYAFGWLLAPALCLAPLALIVRELRDAMGISRQLELPLIAVGVIGFAVAVWRLSAWHQARLRPAHPARSTAPHADGTRSGSGSQP